MDYSDLEVFAVNVNSEPSDIGNKAPQNDDVNIVYNRDWLDLDAATNSHKPQSKRGRPKRKPTPCKIPLDVVSTRIADIPSKDRPAARERAKAAAHAAKCTRTELVLIEFLIARTYWKDGLAKAPKDYEGLSASVLAKITGVSKTQVERGIHGLVQQGLIVKRSDPAACRTFKPNDYAVTALLDLPTDNADLPTPNSVSRQSLFPRRPLSRKLCQGLDPACPEISGGEAENWLNRCWLNGLADLPSNNSDLPSNKSPKPTDKKARPTVKNVGLYRRTCERYLCSRFLTTFGI